MEEKIKANQTQPTVVESQPTPETIKQEVVKEESESNKLAKRKQAKDYAYVKVKKNKKVTEDIDITNMLNESFINWENTFEKPNTRKKQLSYNQRYNGETYSHVPKFNQKKNVLKSFKKVFINNCKRKIKF
jgi:hypothetical protein